MPDQAIDPYHPGAPLRDSPSQQPPRLQGHASHPSRRQMLRWMITGGTAMLLSACGAPAPRPQPTATPTVIPRPTAEPPAPPPPPVDELRILWAKWAPSTRLQQLVAAYQALSGVTITIIQEPWATFRSHAFTTLAARGQAYDLVVGASQWLGDATSHGHYVELTSKFSNDLNGDRLDPSLVRAYAEYPKQSGSYWAYPLHADACGWCYRRDLFEDPAERAAYQAKYGQALAIPTTWADLRTIAEFFTRPDQGLYGISLYSQKSYDVITTGYQNALLSWGAAWADPATNKVQGVLNTQAAVDALDSYRQLVQFAPPAADIRPDAGEACVEQIRAGRAAMGMAMFSYFPDLAAAATPSPIGFFANPAGPGGQSGASRGGQGISIVSYISDDRKAAALAFLRWLAQDEIQRQWSQLGGVSCQTQILQSAAFRQQATFSPALIESLNKAQDFWSVPVYPDLLKVTQTELHAFVVDGASTAQQTLDRIAQQHDQILQQAGLQP